MENINLDNRTLGRWPARVKQPTFAPGQLGYRVLYTRGEDLLPPETVRSSFDQAIQRSIGGVSSLSDGMAARAFGVSSTAFSCTEYRSTTAASLPLIVTTPTGERLTGTFLDYTVSVSPNLLANVVRSCLLWGRTYLRKHRNAQGWPTKLEWLNPQDVLEQVGPDGRVVRYDVTLANGYTREEVSPSNMVYFQLFDPQPGGNGLSRFEVAWRHLNVEQGIVTYAAAFFLNGAQPDGIVTFDHPVQAGDFERAKAEWKRVYRGAQQSHKTAVMPMGVKYTPIQSAPKDLAMVDLKDSEREDICAIFEVDPVLVGLKGVADALSANSTYGTAETAHLRRVTLPFLKMIVLPALNKQWAHRDFDKRDYYTLSIDENAIPQLAESNLVKSETAVNLTGNSLLDYNEARKLVGYAERQGYLVRDPEEALKMWDAGTITLSQFSRLTGAPTIPGTQDYVKFDGVPIPLQELPNLWRYKLLVAPSVYNSELITGQPLPQPVDPGQVVPDKGGATPLDAPQTVAQLPAPEATLANGKSGCLMLALPNQPDLIALQNRVRQLVGDIPVTWNKPDEFHVTLVTMPSMTDEQVGVLTAALQDIEPPRLSLRVGQLNVFDNLGEHALHFRIGRNVDLLDFQDELHATCQALGIPMSAYSEPSQYKPHITMGYSEQPIKRVIFNSTLKVQPTELRFMVDDQVVYQSAHNPPPVKRSNMPLTVGVSLADNQFVRYAKRALSDALTKQGVSAEWVNEQGWCATLAQVEEWTPTAVSNLLRLVDYADTKKVDITTDSFTEVDGNVYLTYSDGLLALHKSITMDLEGAGLVVDYGARNLGILLCRVDKPVDLSAITPTGYPLVANNVTLYLGGERYHSWGLRGASNASLSELKQWRHKAERKGATVEFQPEALDGHKVVQYIKRALTAGLSIDTVFQAAERHLRDSIVLPAIPVTGLNKPAFENMTRFAEYP